MKKLVVIAMILVFLTSCAGLGVRGDNFANDAPVQNMVVKKAESDHWWDVSKMVLGVGLSVLGNAVLLNNFW